MVLACISSNFDEIIPASVLRAVHVSELGSDGCWGLHDQVRSFVGDQLTEQLGLT